MKVSVWPSIGYSIMRISPFVITLCLVLASIVPIYIQGYPGIFPLLTLIGVFHWAVYKPELLPAYAVFFIGLMHDILHGFPLGVNAAVFLIIFGVVTSQHRFFFGKSFPVVWIGFGIVLAGSILMIWILMSLLNNTLIEAPIVLFQYILTLGLYPVLGWCLLSWQKFLLKGV